MAKKSKSAKGKEIDSIRHKDTRVNIPTEELRDFVADAEQAPKSMLYPRDPSLDPQLVWKGKDEQDQNDLEVPVVPIYIQEKIHPHALIEDIRRTGKPAEGSTITLFDDFNGIDDFERKIDFYHHEGKWSNRMILGDSLLVMTSLAEKEGLKGKVQMIYLDPPYGIKFGSNWQVSTRERDVKDGKVSDATRQPEQIRAFRDTWELGVHSYLSYLRDRFISARELLTETGSIFVQIGDENVHLVRCVLDEVFGSDNHIVNITYRVFGVRAGAFLDNISDNIIWYGKHKPSTKYRQLFTIPEVNQKNDYEAVRLYRPGFSPGLSFEFTYKGKKYKPSSHLHWATGEVGLRKLILADRLLPFKADVRFKRYTTDFPCMVMTATWNDTWGEQSKTYVVQTSAKVLQRCILMTTDPGDLVLDPTCGSGTTAFVAENWGRRWITIDTSRVALALARTRLMSAKYPYYILSDSTEGVKKTAEITEQIPPEYKTENEIKKGFVCKTVPHITLKSIANNPDIKDGMTQNNIDEAIARHAGSEILYDQPYEDNKRIRVTGPFTFESLSPHRVLSTDEEMPATEYEGQRDSTMGQYETLIIDNLRKAGVQNRIKNERLKFQSLNPYAGTWIQATGEYVDNQGELKRIAVSIGPEHGTVGPQQIKEAAKEAVQGIDYDILIVCGFAFDPHVSEEAKRYGKLVILPTKMNPDLTLGDELLKKTGAGNLFMVFGEPDVEIGRDKDGKIVIEIKGVDVYDPTTGEIRSNSVDDIACWFIDTDYNGESFFVRHAYFTGADKPFEKLKRALRAEIDEAAWSALYRTKSRPFEPPESGRIAIKVINHYGDEVLKVFDV